MSARQLPTSTLIAEKSLFLSEDFFFDFVLSCLFIAGSQSGTTRTRMFLNSNAWKAEIEQSKFSFCTLLDYSLLRNTT